MNYIAAKRIFDLFLVLLLIIPVMIMIILFSIVIIQDIRSFPIFIQNRGISKKNTFPIFKLRTLKNTISDAGVDIFCKSELLLHSTSFCSWLRRTGLDELPQFINILLGHMSLVGPRPFSIEDIETMRHTMPEYYKRRKQILSKPGLTGMWQIYGDRDLGVDNLLELEEEYERNKSIRLDIKIIFNTIPVVIMGKNGRDRSAVSSRQRDGEVYEFVDL